jgi:hypothetical protein
MLPEAFKSMRSNQLLAAIVKLFKSAGYPISFRNLLAISGS